MEIVRIVRSVSVHGTDGHIQLVHILLDGRPLFVVQWEFTTYPFWWSHRTYDFLHYKQAVAYFIYLIEGNERSR